MTYGYYIIVGIGLILLQTAVIPGIPVLNTCFDFVGLFVIYLGFSRPVREALPVVLLLGLLADNLSGAPFMLYVTAYGWMFFSVRVLSQILQVSLRFRTALIVAAGVLLENLIFILTFVLLGPGTHSPVAATGSVIIQLVWAFTLGPLLVVSFKVAHGIWDNRIGQQAVGRSEAK
jgi:cell shape-determining protein MreD